MNTFKNTLKNIFGYLDYIIFTIVFVSIAAYFIHGNVIKSLESTVVESKVYISDKINGEINGEKDDIIKSLIIWDVAYSEDIENAIMYNLYLLPGDVLDSWISKNSTITICSNTDEYIAAYDDGSDTGAAEIDSEDSLYSIEAFNLIYGVNNLVTCSEIYLLDSVNCINDSLLHEIGHYVQYEYAGISTEYVLPNFKADSDKFAANEQNGCSYFALPDEYFAEMFAYTVRNGVVDKYQDTVVISEIIEEF